MISLAYAKSLANGRGLTWGLSDDPVEGFTNPLWTLMLTLVELLPLQLVWRPLVVQLVGLALLLVAMVRLSVLLRHLRPRQFGSDGPWVAALCFAVYPVWYWSLMGLEMSLVCLLLVELVIGVTRLSEGDASALVPTCLVAGLCALLRMDMLIPVVVAACWLFLVHGERRASVVVFGSAFGSTLAYQVFRLAYFGEWLPNTYYLKMTGLPLLVRLERGVQSLLNEWSAVVLLIVLSGFFLVAVSRRLWTPVLLLALSGVMFGYSVWVGGDAWDLEFVGVSRFAASTLPLGIAGVLLVLPRGSSGLARLKPAFAALLLVVLSNGWLGPDGFQRLGRQLGFAEPPYLVSIHRLVYGEIKLLESRLGEHDLLVSTCWAGIPAYFTNFRFVDCLGYTDRELARLPVNGPRDAMHLGVVAGHDKRYPAKVLEKRPDVVYQLYGYQDLSDLLSQKGYVETGEVWWVRRGLFRRLRKDALDLR